MALTLKSRYRALRIIAAAPPEVDESLSQRSREPRS